MAFQFPLATVLRFREGMEQQEELALKKILAEMLRVRHQIEDLEEEIARAQQMLSEAMRQVLPAVHIDHMTQQINGTLKRKKELVQSYAELDRLRETHTRKYQSAHRARQMLSDMQARQRETYEQERVRSEQKLLDDMFVSRAKRS